MSKVTRLPLVVTLLADVPWLFGALVPSHLHVNKYSGIDPQNTPQASGAKFEQMVSVNYYVLLISLFINDKCFLTTVEKSEC